MFWCDRCINGYKVEEIAPLVVQLVRKSAFNNHTMAEAITNARWVDDILATLCSQGLDQYILLWYRLHITCSNNLNPAQPDEFSWSWSSSGVYLANSTYRMLCHGMVCFTGANCIWKCWDPSKCNFFCMVGLPVSTLDFGLQGETWIVARGSSLLCLLPGGRQP